MKGRSLTAVGGSTLNGYSWAEIHSEPKWLRVAAGLIGTPRRKARHDWQKSVNDNDATTGSSPASTGPAGGHFEGQVGAHYLLSLLTNGEPR